MKSDSGEREIKLSETPDGITFTVFVQPRASRNEICGFQGGELKLRLTAPPVEDAANKLCIDFIAKKFGIARSKVSIIAGAKSRHKTIRVAGICSEEFLAVLKGEPA